MNASETPPDSGSYTINKGCTCFLRIESEFSYVQCIILLCKVSLLHLFREQLETEEASIESLEQKLDKVLKTCSIMIDSGKTYMTQRG